MTNKKEVMVVASSAASGDATLQSQVEYTGRWEKTKESSFDLLCFAIFVAGCVAFFLSGFIIQGKKNFDPSSIDVFGNITDLNGFSDEFKAEHAECQAQLAAGRRLQASPFELEESFFDLFGRDPYIVVVPMAIMMVIAVAWLGALIKFARIVAWTCTVISVVLPGFLGIVLLVEGVEPITPALLIAYSVVLCLIAYKTREDIDQAAERMRLAVAILMQKPVIFLAAFVIELLFCSIWLPHFGSPFPPC